MNNINLTTEELATITAALQRSAGHKKDGNRVAAIQCKNRIMDALDAAYARREDDMSGDIMNDRDQADLDRIYAREIAMRTRRLMIHGYDFHEVATVEGCRGQAPTLTFKDGREPVTLKSYPGEDLYQRCCVWLNVAKKEV